MPIDSDRYFMADDSVAADPVSSAAPGEAQVRGGRQGEGVEDQEVTCRATTPPPAP